MIFLSVFDLSVFCLLATFRHANITIITDKLKVCIFKRFLFLDILQIAQQDINYCTEKSNIGLEKRKKKKKRKKLQTL